MQNTLSGVQKKLCLLIFYLLSDFFFFWPLLGFLECKRNDEWVFLETAIFKNAVVVVVNQFWHFIAAFELFVLFFSSVQFPDGGVRFR